MTRRLMLATISIATFVALDSIQAQTSGDAAFVFAYRMKPGMEDAFERGYKRHLGWHEQHRDSLTWLAWSVYDGPNADTFVDGVFGIQLAAFDARVDPPGDRADADSNVSPFGDPTYRAEYRRRRDLSTSSRLEEGKPGRFQRVTTIIVDPSRVSAFEQSARAAVSQLRSRVDYTVYERVSGGEVPAYQVTVQFSAWKDLDGSLAATDTLLRMPAGVIRSAESEIWLYRADLTYFPKR